jgi:aminoglycoside phosphotransferase (APT) family kinase protein
MFLREQPHPILIAKVPRLASYAESLDREASNLGAILFYRSNGFDSIPRVIAYEDFNNHRILIETALNGQAMSSSLVRRNPKGFVEAAITWLIEFHQATRQDPKKGDRWYHQLVERPCAQFMKTMSNSTEEYPLIKLTQKHVRSLRQYDIPLVFEHGDFGPPNILSCNNSTIGVVDWELAEPKGLPALDLFFFLTLCMFAIRRARKPEDYLVAFKEAFFGQNPWAKPFINRYRKKLNISPEIMQPLFLLCWSRYSMNIAHRLNAFGLSSKLLSNETVLWLKSNRYYALWQYVVDHVDELNLID